MSITGYHGRFLHDLHIDGVSGIFWVRSGLSSRQGKVGARRIQLLYTTCQDIVVNITF